MKKLPAILMAAALLLGLAACNSGGKEDEKNELTLVVSYDGINEVPYEYESELTVKAMAAGLSELTGLDFSVTAAENGEAGLSVDWAAGSTLVANLDDRELMEGLVFYDYDGLAWFMMDSLHLTIQKNYPSIVDVYYTMDGGKELVLEDLSYPKNFTFDTPYMGSEFYLAHDDGRGDIIDEGPPPEPADVNWWGDWGSEAGMLYINNYNNKGMGWSFAFKFDNDGVIFDGVAAVDTEDPRLASYENYDFQFTMGEDADGDSIWVTIGSQEVFYVRTEDAVG